MQGKSEGNPQKSRNKRASKHRYISPNQLTICGFETPFEQQLTQQNRWVRLAKLIPWDKIVNKYNMQFTSSEGRRPISGRIVLGAVIIKHMLALDDRETIEQIQENMFMQYFLGYSSFDNEAPFDASLFVDIRKRLNADIMNQINEIILKHHFEQQAPSKDSKPPPEDACKVEIQTPVTPVEELEKIAEELPNKGRLLLDATVAPQEITYPTDLKLLNASRQKTEQMIDVLYRKELHGTTKVRTYRELAQKHYLTLAKKKNKRRIEIRKAIQAQLGYLRRNLNHLRNLLQAYALNGRKLPKSWKGKWKKYYETIQTVYTQQKTMFDNRTHTIENRIVSIHQPHVRPIVRGKEGKKVEFGCKLQVSMTDGFILLDRMDWNNFNEGTCVKDSIETYKKRFGFYPKELLADKIYCTRENRKYLKELNIELRAKPLGRKRKDEALSIQVSPGERNPIEGKFGQAKRGYRMNCIFARLKQTSESWISSIALVLNLVTLMGRASLRLYFNLLKTIFCQFNTFRVATS